MLVELTCAADAMPNTTRVTHLGNAAKAMATWGGLQAGLRRGEGLLGQNHGQRLGEGEGDAEGEGRQSRGGCGGEGT